MDWRRVGEILGTIIAFIIGITLVAIVLALCVAVIIGAWRLIFSFM